MNPPQTEGQNSRSTEVPAAPRACGTHVAVVVFSHYPSDPRPRRAAEALVQLGMNVEVISLQQHKNELRTEICNGVKVLRIPLKQRRGGKLAYILQYGAFIAACFVLLAKRSFTRRYNIVHVHNMPDILVLSALIPKALGAKVILDLHDPMPELMMSIYGLRRASLGVRLLEYCEKWSVRFADLVLTPNSAFEVLFASRGCPAGKLRVVMNSPDECIFRLRQPPVASAEDGVGPKPFVMMFHGALVERHGLDIAVQAFETVRGQIPNCELRIFGRRTAYIDKVMCEVLVKGLQESVKYLGAKTLEQIAEEIAACDLGLIPNRLSAFTELNMPTRIFEYLACGKPVIAPGTKGILDYLGREEIVLFDPRDPADLARKMLFVYAEPQKVESMVRRAQTIYLRHRWSRERSRFCSLALGLLAESKPAAGSYL